MREGSWKLILGNGSGGRELPKGKPFQRPFQLYNLSSDPGEQRDQLKANPDKARQLEQELAFILGSDQIPDFNQGPNKDGK